MPYPRKAWRHDFIIFTVFPRLCPFKPKPIFNESDTTEVFFLLRKFRDNIAQQLRFGHLSTKFAKATAFAH